MRDDRRGSGGAVRCLRPDLIVRSIHDLDYDALHRQGVLALLYDLENTLCRWRDWQLDARTRALLRRLQDQGLRIAVLTNARVPPQHPLVLEMEELGIPVVASARKPFRQSFRRTLALLGVSPAQAAMIGDQVLTDVLGGRRAGMYTVLVEPVAHDESRPTKVNRWVERRLGWRIPAA
ncbi:TPA: YqeG family HAD IIIA-type phosphatase [Candidatus Acetothermia bacterium]|nr:YqeG family HAD IIIA-type phosphatase [Candidatus Acetothermia bacterium]